MASNDLNSVAIVGRLTRDAEVRYSQSGSAVASLSIAVNHSRKDGDQWISEVDYFDVSLFGKQAEALRSYLTKGKQIAVQGALRQDRWEKDGQKFSKVKINASNIELLGGRSDNGGSLGAYGSMGGQERQAFAPRQNYDAPPPDGDSFGADGGEFPEDIPF